MTTDNHNGHEPEDLFAAFHDAFDEEPEESEETRLATIRQEEEAKQIGMGLAEAGAGDWLEYGYELVSATLPADGRFSSNDVRRLIIQAGYVVDRWNAIGSLFNKACNRGIIEPVGITKLDQPGRHRGIVQVWQAKRRD